MQENSEFHILLIDDKQEIFRELRSSLLLLSGKIHDIQFKIYQADSLDKAGEIIKETTKFENKVVAVLDANLTEGDTNSDDGRQILEMFKQENSKAYLIGHSALSFPEVDGKKVDIDLTKDYDSNYGLAFVILKQALTVVGKDYNDHELRKQMLNALSS